LPTFLFAQDEFSVAMSLSRDVISIDDHVYLTITISGPSQNLPKPELPNLSLFDTYSQGTSTNISIVNGRVESSLTYNYVLQPRQEGTFIIKPAAIAYNQKRYESNEVTLKVVGSGDKTSPGTTQPPATTTVTGDTKELFLTAEVNKKTAYVNEQITLTVKFFYSSKLYSQPDYTAPQTTDFWSEVIEPQKTYTQVINGRRYGVVEINTALFPTRSGDLTIGPAMVTATIPSRRQARQNDPFSMFDDFFAQGENVTVRSRSVDVKVLPLPSENKPANFSGTVGDYKISATPDKTTVDVNQPVTITYKFSGTGNIKTVAEPAIGDLKDFRVYRASSSEKVSKLDGIVGGTKIFEEVYMPKRAGKLTIPPVEFNYFDPRTRKYNVLTTRPVELTVQAASGGDIAEIPLRRVAGRVVDPNAKDIRFIKTDYGDLVKKKSLILFRPSYLIVNIIPALVLAVVWMSSLRREKLASDIGYARARRAKKMAKKRLTEASRLSQSQQPAKFYAEIRSAIFSYVADKLNVSSYGMTSDKLLDIIGNAGADEELMRSATGLLRTADFAQYSSAEVTREQIAESLNTAERIMVRLEEMKIA